MKAKKGCVNPECSSCKRKTLFKFREATCKTCGEPLVYVCQKCHMQLSDENKKFCERCIAVADDNKYKTEQVIKGLMLVAGAIFLLVLGIIDLFVPDPLPFLDEIVFFGGAVACIVGAMVNFFKKK